MEPVGLAEGTDSGDNSPMPTRSHSERPARSKRPGERKAPDAAHVLVIDVGGSHVKFRMGARGQIRRFVSGPDMTAADMARQVRKLAHDLLQLHRIARRALDGRADVRLPFHIQMAFGIVTKPESIPLR